MKKKKKVFEDLRSNQEEITLADGGGEVEECGTGTSDSVPAIYLMVSLY